MSLLATFEAKLATVWHDLTGEARTELEALLAALKAEEAKIGPLVTAAEADLKAAVAAAEPELKAAVESRLGQLVADILAIVGAPAGM